MEDFIEMNKSVSVLTNMERRPFQLTAGILLFFLSLYGTASNVFVLVGFMTDPKYSSEFYKLCASKTVSNTVVLFCHLIWIAPCTILNNYYLPGFVPNVVISQIGGVCFYLIGGLTQVCMAVNRFLIIVYAAKIHQQIRANISYVMLGISWVVGFLSFPACTLSDIAVVYDVSTLGYHQQVATDNTFFTLQLASFFALICCSNVFNLLTTIFLFQNSKNPALGSKENSSRRRKNVRLFIQNVTQDCIPLIDVIDTFVANTYCTGNFAIFSTTLTLVLVHALDGTVMLVFSKPLTRLRAYFGQSKTTKVTAVTAITASSTTN